MNEQNGDNWFLALILKVCLVVWAAVMFSKTAEVFTALAPATILGQQGLETLYGVITASLIEGVAVVLALLPSTHSNRNAIMYAGFLYVISTFCQFLDYSLVKDAANQSQTEAFFGWIALGIPSLGFGGLLMLLWTVTKDPRASGSQTNFKGLKHMLPNPRKIWNGDGYVPPKNVVLQQEVPKVRKVKSGTNGEHPDDEANP